MPPRTAERPYFAPVFTLGSVASILTILASVVGVTAYIGDVKGQVNTNNSRISALEQMAQRDRAEYLRRLERIEDGVNQIRNTQATRLPGQ